MARFRNDFNEDRVVPTLGYTLVAAGQVVTVPDDEWEHWDAGGWTALDPRPARPEAEAAPAVPAPAAVPAPPAAEPAIPAAAAAPEGTESA